MSSTVAPDAKFQSQWQGSRALASHHKRTSMIRVRFARFAAFDEFYHCLPKRLGTADVRVSCQCRESTDLLANLAYQLRKLTRAFYWP
jgi:hypothetical protein